jgi:hypothetical protein
MRKSIPCVGLRKGRLVVIRDLPNFLVEVECDCGTKKIIHKGQVVSGSTKSCGCLLRENLRRFSPMNRERKPSSEAQKEARRKNYMSGHLPKWMYS